MVKVYDKVKLKNCTEKYRNLGVTEEDFGDCVAVDGNLAEVLFYNTYNRGDYAFIVVNVEDLVVLNGLCDNKIKNQIDDFVKSLDRSKNSLNPIRFDEVCCVRLLKMRKSYENVGLKVGCVGWTALNYANFGKTLIDFSGNNLKNSDKHMNLISVKLEDLEKV